MISARSIQRKKKIVFKEEKQIDISSKIWHLRMNAPFSPRSAIT
jgi:hypothetical protein